MTGIFLQAFIYLIAAVITVPIARRLGLGSVLGYLIAGVVIGPAAGLVGEETAAIQHVAEFGVVMMLFLVGLELDPKMLWAMRTRLFGLGGLQLLLTTLAVMCIGLLFNLSWQAALAIGLILALSSTAIVLQSFSEKHLMKTEGGRSAFSVLLFQDIAVIPILALLPLLAMPELTSQIDTTSVSHEINLVADLPAWARGFIIPLTVMALVVGGHYLSYPLFNFVAKSGLPEIFTATALMLVIGISALMGLVGLSPALGTFLAGVVLANSEFRHELESNIEPFKGLLLGLFFITVGAGINVDILKQEYILIISLAIGLMFLKALVIYIIAAFFQIKMTAAWLFSLSLAQAGEFGFVLLNFSLQKNVLTPELVQILLLVVSLSMFLTPTLFIVFDKIIVPFYQKLTNEPEEDEIDEKGKVIIAGVGRFGQVINRLLTANGIDTVVLDHEAGQIKDLRNINVKGYFGDATKPSLLHTAGIDEAELLIVAIDNRESAVTLVHYVKSTYPTVKILARAFDREHYYKLLDAGADEVIKETFHSALELGGMALQSLSFHPFQVAQKKAAFNDIEKSSSELLYQSWMEGDESKTYDKHFFSMFLQVEESIKDAMLKDRMDSHKLTEREWTPPPKNYIEILENLEIEDELQQNQEQEQNQDQKNKDDK